MIRSMTGFGEASQQVSGRNYVLELRSLNNRYFKALFRLPDYLSSLEAELESYLRQNVYRGSLTVTVREAAAEGVQAARINESALEAYLAQLKRLGSDLGQERTTIDLSGLLALPGVLITAEDEPAILDQLRPAVLALAEEALQRLNEMRHREGKMLSDEILRHIQVVRDRTLEIRERGPKVVQEYHMRLRARVDEMLARAELKVNETDLIKEVAIFADRADVCEEVARIDAHLEQYEQILRSNNGEPAGRTLDFLSQELLREANTIASKSNDAAISRAAVEIKSAIDRIKEQVQNVE